MFGSKDLLFAKGPSGYKISNSLRFRSSASAYLSRTPSTTSGSSRTTWTWSGWVKRGTLSGVNNQSFFGCYISSSDYVTIQFRSTDDLDLQTQSSGTVPRKTSTAVFRDPSAWYHIVAVVDTSNATAGDRLRLYVNGVRITNFAISTDPSSSQSFAVNSTTAQTIGQLNSATYFDGYLAEVNFIDGQALTPSSFGQNDATTGVWTPKAYTGTYGTNGFYLKFADNSGATATTIGKDSSGNGNNWTPNNISVSAGVNYDSMIDSPTNYADGGNGRGNYCVLNPISLPGVAPTNGNLFIPAVAGVTYYNVRSTIALPTTGQFYWETTWGTANYATAGIWGVTSTWSSSGTDYIGGLTYQYALGELGYSDFRTFTNGVNTATGITVASNAVIGIAFDASTGKLWFAVNGTWVNSGNPASGTSPAYTVSSDTYFPAFSVRGNESQSVNFGQRPFTYTPPSGFKALNTFNLPTGTITTSGSFTGNGSPDGPFIYLNGVPTAMTINGNAVTFATHADKLANGFKVRSSLSSYNVAGSNTYSITTTGANFKNANAQGNP